MFGKAVTPLLIRGAFLSEILKAHRTSYLYNTYGMYNVPISIPKLEETFKDQLLVRSVARDYGGYVTC